MSLRRTLPVLALVVPLACNALTGIGDLDVDESSSTSLGDGGSNATPASNDGGSSSDTGLGDDGSVIVADDSGVDATSDGDAAPLGFCAALTPAAALCTDFDDAVFPGPWTTTTAGMGTASLVTSTFRSSSRALHLGSPGVTSGTAFLSRTFPTVAQTEVVLGFAIRVGQQRPLENELAVIFLGSSGGNPYQVQLELLDNGVLNLEEEAPAADGTVPEKNEALGVNLVVGQWTRVTITLTIGATASSVKFEIEGSAPVTKTALAHDYKAAPRIVIGHDSTTTAAYGMDYDDIFVRVQ